MFITCPRVYNVYSIVYSSKRAGQRAREAVGKIRRPEFIPVLFFLVPPFWILKRSSGCAPFTFAIPLRVSSHLLPVTFLYVFIIFIFFLSSAICVTLHRNDNRACPLLSQSERKNCSACDERARRIRRSMQNHQAPIPITALLFRKRQMYLLYHPYYQIEPRRIKNKIGKRSLACSRVTWPR